MSSLNNCIIHTDDQQMQQLLETAESVATSKANVLLNGESGVGKELLARFIHSKSHRSSRPFYAVNCAALPEGLLESELFGFEKGAFTNATQAKPGKFEMADGSTFLLDEVTEIPLFLQAKLLRVIQEGEVERLGSTSAKKIDVRIIATSNRDIGQMIAKGEFREDLFYRLNVIPLNIPPLRERQSDIDLLSQFFLEIACAENGIPAKLLNKSAKTKLHQWHWPGNVRELKNVVERSVLLSSQRELGHEQMLIDISNEKSKKSSDLKPGMTVAEAERLLIIKTLEYTSQNRTRAADLLGISIRTLRNKINEYKKGEQTL